MPSNQPRQTLADYVVIAVSPVLIMAVVGSLVFFLLEVLYAGAYEGRMQWTLFFFVFGAVLIARISMETAIAGRAGVYGLALAVVVWLALQSYVEYSSETPLAAFGWAIHMGLIALIWWCAHRLTWDCTSIDDADEASGAGLLQAAGLEKQGTSSTEERASAAGEEAEPSNAASPSPGLLGWWKRCQSYREKQRRSRPPGVWVVYFSLAALPLFGLGQSLISLGESERRRYVFWLMVIYVAGGLGLLVTTSFLGLRRYLRQRKLQMPVAMTGMWLAVGGGLIVLVLTAGALLPRPHAEYPLVRMVLLGSQDREASDFAVQRDSPGQGEGSPSSDPSNDPNQGQSGDGTRPNSQQGGQGTSGSSGTSPGQGQQGSGSQGNQQGGQGGNNSGQQKPGQQGSQPKPKAGEQGGQSGDQQGKPGEQSSEGQGGSSSGSGPRPVPLEQHPPTNPVSPLLSKLGALADILKWIVFGLLALAVVFFVLRSGLKFLANFTDWARRLLEGLRAWWEALWGRPKEVGASEAEADAVTETRAPLPFASFRNPFTDGTARHRSPEELVRYSFEALEAWAWERGQGRNPEETPLEFAAQLGADVPALEAEAQRLAVLYARIAYARGSLPKGCQGMLQQFWECLDKVVEQPLSA